MNINYCDTIYQTENFENKDDGCIGLELIATTKSEVIPVARITFWDAEGQFFIDLFSKELPLQIVEEFISEAKKQVKVS